MTVKLMLTCLCDAFYGEVGITTVRVLEHAGCTVVFPKQQTCCGQPPFNSGDWPAARVIARHCQESLGLHEDNPVVTPSSSCAAMIREGYPQLFGTDDAPLVWELAEFLVHELKITSWPRESSDAVPIKLVYHRACHGRALHLKDEQEMLLRSIPGVELESIAQPEQCCGFGGAFSITHPTVSSGIGLEKLRNAADSGAEVLVSGDMGCLMHLNGLIGKQGIPLRTMHFAEVLAAAIPSGVPA